MNPWQKRVDVFGDGRCVLYCGDCLEILRTVPAGSVDAVVTDPPYSTGTIKEAGAGIRKAMTRSIQDIEWFATDSLSTNGFWWLAHACAVQWKRVLKPGGHVLSFIDWRQMPQLAGAIESADLKPVNLLIWDKTYFGMGRFFRLQYEMILHYTRGVGADALRHDVSNVLRFPPVRNGEHYTQKPVELVAELISVIVPLGGLVLDPFMGSGTTGLAAIQLGRRFVGIEIDPHYFEVAHKRILDATPLFMKPQEPGKGG